MINRPDYINAITPFIDVPVVKILAGIRRCGKSTIFEMLKQELLNTRYFGRTNHYEEVYGNGYSRRHLGKEHV